LNATSVLPSGAAAAEMTLSVPGSPTTTRDPPFVPKPGSGEPSAAWRLTKRTSASLTPFGGEATTTRANPAIRTPPSSCATVWKMNGVTLADPSKRIAPGVTEVGVHVADGPACGCGRRLGEQQNGRQEPGRPSSDRVR
jgi:hypothetical protein